MIQTVLTALIVLLILRIVRKRRRVRTRVRVRFYHNGVEVKGMISKLQIGKTYTAKIVGLVDAAGNPAEFDGAPSWTALDPSLITVTPSADGKTAEVTLNGPLGASKLQVTGDVDMSPDVVENLMGEGEFEVIGGKAVAFNIAFEEKV